MPGRHIREWHAADFTMSSRELLVLLEELPEDSEFKKARDRTYRIVRWKGADPLLDGKGKIVARTGETVHFTPHGRITDDVELLADNVVDWTRAEHVQARIARELAQANWGKDADFTGLIPPLAAWAESETEVTDEAFEAASRAFEAQLGLG